MGVKVKLKDGSVLSIDPQNLFNRLISLALVSSQDTTTDLNKILSYERAPFPPPLFESEDLMREAHKLAILTSLSLQLLLSPQRPFLQPVMQQIYTLSKHTSRCSSGWETTTTWIQPIMVFIWQEVCWLLPPIQASSSRVPYRWDILQL